MELAKVSPVKRREVASDQCVAFKIEQRAGGSWANLNF